MCYLKFSLKNQTKGNKLRSSNKLSLITEFLIVLVILSGCKGNSGSSTTEKNPVVAAVNGEAITAKQFIEKAEVLENRLSVNFDVFQERKKLLDNIITSTLLSQKAREEKLDQELEFKEFLATQYLKRKVPNASISDEEALKYFELNKNKYEKIKAAHILIKPAKPGDKNEEDKAFKKASGILLRILNGEDFGKLAREYSEDKANASSGGDLGFFGRGLMVKEFDEAAFSLKEQGDLSKVVKTEFGCHIIKLLDSQRGFEYFKQKITDTLRFEKEKSTFEKLIEDIRKSAKIEVNDDTLKDIKIVNEPLLTK